MWDRLRFEHFSFGDFICEEEEEAKEKKAYRGGSESWSR